MKISKLGKEIKMSIENVIGWAMLIGLLVVLFVVTVGIAGLIGAIVPGASALA